MYTFSMFMSRLWIARLFVIHAMRSLNIADSNPFGSVNDTSRNDSGNDDATSVMFNPAGWVDILNHTISLYADDESWL